MKAAVFSFTFGVLLFSFTKIVAQELKHCGSTEATERYLKEHPEQIARMKQDRQKLEEHTKNYIQAEQLKANQRGNTVYIIPVVFHILHQYGPENISDEQIFDQMRILNEDFRKLNADISDVVPAFINIAGDAEIEFRLAEFDPQGNCTNGIDRIVSDETFIGNDGSKLNRWGNASHQYLNIWIVNNINVGLKSVAGYAYFPGTVSENVDGIMILHTYVGSIGTSTPEKSRALTHEIGHYLNLSHTWGDGNTPGCDGTNTKYPCNGVDNCNSNDYVPDTPPTIGWSSCNLQGASCGGTLDNVQNYMEYSYCCKMFTKGQAMRMRSALTSSVSQRNKLWSAANLNATGTNGIHTLCKADISVKYTTVCEGQVINFKDASYFGQNSWSWNFQGGSPSSSNIKDPSIAYTKAGTYNVDLTVSNGNDSQTKIKTNYITVLPAVGKPVPMLENFEAITFFPNNEWLLIDDNTDLKNWVMTQEAAYSGKKSLKLDNYNTSNGQLSSFVSSTIDLTSLSKVNISFRVAYAQNDTSKDVLKVYISNSCGESWLLRWAKSGTALSTAQPQSWAFVPTIDQWQQVVLNNIPISYLVKNFRIKFEFKNNGGNNIFIDDIYVYDPAKVGMEEEMKNNEYSIKVFPNPFNITATIEVKNTWTIGSAKEISFIMYDVLGREVKNVRQVLNTSKETHIIKIERTGLESGIYFYRVLNSTLNYEMETELLGTGKIIIE